MDRGIIYVASGLDQKESLHYELSLSIRSLKKHHPGIPVTLFTDSSDTKVCDVDETVPLRSLAGHSRFLNRKIGFAARSQIYIQKVWSMLRTPYDRTVFLDCDTYVCDDIGEMFDRLDYSDLVLTNAPEINWHAQPPAFISCRNKTGYNTGVVGFRRSDQVRLFFEEWLIRTVNLMAIDEAGCDQAAFKPDLLGGRQLNIDVVDNTRFNARINFRGFARAMVEENLVDDVAILHAHSYDKPVVRRFLDYVDRYKTAIRNGSEMPSLPLELFAEKHAALSF